MKKKIGQRILASLLAISMVMPNVQMMPVKAADAGVTPVVSLDFEAADDSFDGSFDGGNGATAEVMTDSEYKLAKREDHYVDLTGGQYLTVTRADGKSPLTGLNEVTIMYDSCYMGDVGNAWAFCADSSSEVKNHEDASYLGIIEAHSEGSRVERYGSSGWGDSKSMSFSTSNALDKGNWKSVAVVVNDTSLSLYQNGELKGSTTVNEASATLADILGENSVFWIGYANWTDSGEFYNGYIDNFRIYNGALSQTAIESGDYTGATLLADFDFETRTVGDGGTVKFTSNGYTASCANGVDDIWKSKDNKDNALDLRDANKMLYVMNNDGTPVLKGKEAVTIVYDSYLPSGAGYANWTFWAAPGVEKQETVINKQTYTGVIEEEGNKIVTNRYCEVNASQVSMSTTTAPVVDAWKKVAVVFDGVDTYFYVNGHKTAERQGKEGEPTLVDILGATGGVFQIGGANFGNGEYYKGMLDNFRIYDGALEAGEISALHENGTNPSQTDHPLLADFDFDSYEDGFAGGGAVAKPYLLQDVDGDSDMEMYLTESNTTWLNVLKDNKSPLADADEITISYKSIQKEYLGRSNWTISIAQDTNAHSGSNFVGVNDQHSAIHTLVRNTGTGADLYSNHGVFLERMKRVDVVIEKTEAETGYTAYLYVDGRLNAQRDISTISGILSAADGVLQIGKTKWVDNEYYRGYIDDVRIYTTAKHPVTTLTVENQETDGSGNKIPIRVLAGHLQETLKVAVEVDGEARILEPNEYSVTNYKSTATVDQEITLTYGELTTTALIRVYNEVNSNQKQLLDDEGNPMFTVNTTWYDFLTDPEREGKLNNKVWSRKLVKDDQGNFISSESEYVQFNNAVEAYWTRKGLDGAAYHPLYWGGIIDINNDNMSGDPNVNAGTAPWEEYGGNFLGSIKQVTQAQAGYAVRGVMDNELTTSGTAQISEIETPYFGHDSQKLLADAQGEVYMNVYNNILMPLIKSTTDTGIDYYEFYCGDENEDTGTIEISADEENTVKWLRENDCTDDTGGVSFLPFNTPETTPTTQNNGFAMRMNFPCYITYDGKLLNNKGVREDIVFEFEGDDDFFLYIDGHLVLDIGGSHPVRKGSINFATGEVWIDKSISVRGTVETGDNPQEYRAKISEIAPKLDLSDPTQQHEIVIYYMERGKHESNLKMRFNLPMENSLTLKKTVDTSAVNNYLVPDIMDKVIEQEKFLFDVKSDYEKIQGPVTDNNWTMYTTVLEEGYLTSYFNDVKIGTVKTDISLDEIVKADGTVDAYIGKSAYSNDPFLKGSVRDFRIYDSALTSDQVTDIYSGTETAESPKAFIQYDFSTMENAENGAMIENIGSAGAEGYAAKIVGAGAEVNGAVLTLPGGTPDGDTSADNDPASVTLPGNLIKNGDGYRKTLTISVLMKNETGPGNYSGLFIGKDTNAYWLFNPQNPVGHMKSVISISGWQNEKGVEDAHGELKAVDGETVQYYDGVGYTYGSISNGVLSLGAGQSAVFMQREPADDEDVGFMVIPGTKFTIEEQVNTTKYETPTWVLKDTNGVTLGSGEGTIIDDNQSTYGVSNDGNVPSCNVEGDFALLNKDGRITADETTGMVRINLSAEYTNKVKTGDISITKKLRGVESGEDVFTFNLTLSDVFGTDQSVYGGTDVLYQGIYYVNGIEKTATDGKIEITADQTAVIKGIPVLTTYKIQEIPRDGYQAIGEPEIIGTVNTIENAVEITNVQTPSEVFYAWTNHETVLPMSNGETLKTLYDGENEKETDVFAPSTGNYTAWVENGEIHFKGNVHGSVTLQYVVTDAQGNEKIVMAMIHIYEPDNKAYVLDYGLPVELNTGDDTFGITKNSSGEYEVAGKYLTIPGATASIEFKGFRDPATVENRESWSGYTPVADGADVTLETEQSTLVWSAASENLSLVYNPLDFMSDADVYDYRVDITKDASVDMGSDDSTMTAADGVRMRGTLTVVPASVVYYEDDFEAVQITTVGASREGNTEDLWQSNDQSEVYGHDKTYASGVNDELANSQETTKGNLILHYDFKNVSGTTIPDVAGYMENGDANIINITENDTPTVSRGVLKLSGGNKSKGSYVKLPKISMTDRTALTISAWLSASDAVFGRVAMSIYGKDGNYWLVNPRTDRGVMRSVISLGAGEITAYSDEGANESSSWALYTTVIESGKITFYCNGKPVKSVSDGTISLVNLGTDLEAYIGYSKYVDTNNDALFNGSVRDVRIYDYALDAAEVKALYQAPYDSAGGVTRLEADTNYNTSSNIEDMTGSMVFTFKGTGFELIGRTTDTTAGVFVRINDAEGKAVKATVVDTFYRNGELYQLPIISVKDLAYGEYTVQVKALKTSQKVEDGDGNEFSFSNTSVYIDGIRIYNPGGDGTDNENKAITDHYLATEVDNVTISEVRELLLGQVKYNGMEESWNNETSSAYKTETMAEGSSVALVTFESDTGTTVYHGGKSNSENLTLGGTIDNPEVLEEILDRGPNNEVYLSYGNAIAFCAKPTGDIRTIQVEAKKVTDGNESPAIIKVLSKQANPQTITVDTNTSMYYDIDISKCPTLSDGSYLVVLACAGDGMVSYTNLKYKGYYLQAPNLDTSAITDMAIVDTYELMRYTFENTSTVEELPFTDVEAGVWYENAVCYVYKNEIMTGVNATTFAPYETISRAQMAVILYRMAGSPAVEYCDIFTDVADGTWYTDAVLWAQDNEIVTGYSETGTFGPGDELTREQMAVMMYRYATYKGDNVDNIADISGYPDYAQVSAFAETAMAWAVTEGLMSGSNGRLCPQDTANRAMCAAVIWRFMEQ